MPKLREVAVQLDAARSANALQALLVEQKRTNELLTDLLKELRQGSTLSR
jgi:ferritin-like metal-binding protein YciE